MEDGSWIFAYSGMGYAFRTSSTRYPGLVDKTQITFCLPVRCTPHIGKETELEELDTYPSPGTMQTIFISYIFKTTMAKLSRYFLSIHTQFNQMDWSNRFRCYQDCRTLALASSLPYQQDHNAATAAMILSFDSDCFHVLA